MAKNNFKNAKKNQNSPRILKVSENRKSCRKVAKQLVAEPNFKKLVLTSDGVEVRDGAVTQKLMTDLTI